MLNQFIDNYDGNDLRQVISSARIASMNTAEFSETMDQFQDIVTSTQIQLKNIIELSKDIKKKYKMKVAIFWILVSILIILFIACSILLGFFASKDKPNIIYIVYGLSGGCAIGVIIYEFLTVLINFVST